MFLRQKQNQIIVIGHNPLPFIVLYFLFYYDMCLENCFGHTVVRIERTMKLTNITLLEKMWLQSPSSFPTWYGKQDKHFHSLDLSSPNLLKKYFFCLEHLMNLTEKNENLSFHVSQVGRSGVDRASSSDARGLGFEPRPLHFKKYHLFTRIQVALRS